MRADILNWEQQAMRMRLRPALKRSSRRMRKMLDKRRVKGQAEWERMLALEAEISKYQPRSSWPLIVRYAMLYSYSF